VTEAGGRTLSDGRWLSPSAERNKGPILEVLRRVLPERGMVLEIASGTGQHVVHFGRALPELVWQPSDPDPDLRGSVCALTGRERLANVRAPLDLDVREASWPIEAAQAIVCINMLHVAPWEATGALMAGAGRTLAKRGVLFLYGPYRRDGRHTAPSNEAFDASLRGQNPEWGVRDLESVAAAGAACGLELGEVVAMPANNLSLVFRKI
jgi:hypothetical protein